MVVRDAMGAFSVGLLDTVNPNEQEQERMPSRLLEPWKLVCSCFTLCLELHSVISLEMSPLSSIAAVNHQLKNAN